MWGKVHLWESSHLIVRIIPTGVGKRSGCNNVPVSVPDHPHGCGEKVQPPSFAASRIGSSPRVWGKVKRNSFSCLSSRIIPTGVGKRFSADTGAGPPTDHPHGCGEKLGTFGGVPFKIGSSPRVWGKDQAGGKRCYICRIIPTGVGKSHTVNTCT